MQPPAHYGVPLLHTTIALLILSWATVAGRLSVRRWLKPEAMGLDDYMMCAGLVVYTVTCSLVIACCFYGAGQFSEDLTDATVMQGTKIFYIAEFFYASCTVPVKASICICLVRIADARRRFVWSLYALVALQTGTTLIFVITIANICHPVTAMWGETGGICDANLNSHIGFYFSAVSIVTDLSLAVLPAFLLWPIQMKRRLKASVAVLLGLGAFASCATIVRLRYLTLYNNQAEFMYSAGPIGLWSVVEEGIGIIAGSLPTLRPLLNLPLFGGTRVATYPSKGASQGYDLENTQGAWTGGGAAGGSGREDRDGRGLKTTVTGSASATGAAAKAAANRHESKLSKDGDSDRESQTYILKETRVTVSSGPASETAAEDWKWRRVNGWNPVDGES
ncbi:unnamed protein product [Discula destructiva]